MGSCSLAPALHRPRYVWTLFLIIIFVCDRTQKQFDMLMNVGSNPQFPTSSNLRVKFSPLGFLTNKKKQLARLSTQRTHGIARSQSHQVKILINHFDKSIKKLSPHIRD